LNIIASFRVFLYLSRLVITLRKNGFPASLQVFKKTDTGFVRSRWDTLFSCLPPRHNVLYVVNACPGYLPFPAELPFSLNDCRAFLLRGRYFSPSNPGREISGRPCYLSEWFKWAHEHGFRVFCRFLEDETIEMFLVASSLAGSFETFYRRYNPFYAFSCYEPGLPFWCIPEKGWYLHDNRLEFDDFASLYVLSLNSQPVRLCLTVKGENPRTQRVRFHKEFTRVWETEEPQFTGDIDPVWLNPYQGHGLQWVVLGDGDTPVTFHKHVCRQEIVSHDAFCKTLEPDRYQRHRVAAEVLVKGENKTGKTCTVGDFGGNPGLLHNFLPHHQITVIDRQPLDYPRHMLEKDLEKEGRQFDYTVALDVLEHVPPAGRKEFLKKLYLSSRRGVILTFPFRGKAIKKAEKLLFDFERTFLGRENHYLAEHLKNPLPDPAVVEAFCKERHIPFRKYPAGWLPHWFYMLFLVILRDCAPEKEKEINSTLLRYNQQFASSDNYSPSYRLLWVMGELAENLEEKDREELPIRELHWSPCSLPELAARYGLKKEAEWLESRYENLKELTP